MKIRPEGRNPPAPPRAAWPRPGVSPGGSGLRQLHTHTRLLPARRRTERLTRVLELTPHAVLLHSTGSRQKVRGPAQVTTAPPRRPGPLTCRVTTPHSTAQAARAWRARGRTRALGTGARRSLGQRFSTGRREGARPSAASCTPVLKVRRKLCRGRAGLTVGFLLCRLTSPSQAARPHLSRRAPSPEQCLRSVSRNRLVSGAGPAACEGTGAESALQQITPFLHVHLLNKNSFMTI